MKILIVAAYFHPFTHPRAHRWTEIAANWAAAGHEVHVVTAKNPSEKAVSEVRGATVHRAGFASLKEAFNFFFTGKIRRGELAAATKKGGGAGLTRVLGFLNDIFWRPFYWPDDAALWYFPARRMAQKLLSQNGFDAIVTVSMPFTAHLVGLFLKRESPKTCWLVDIGDPVCFQRFPVQNPFFYGKLTRRFEKRVLLEADIVLVTNPGLQNLYQKKYGIEPGSLYVVGPISTGKALAATGQNHRDIFEKKGTGTIDIGFFGTFFRGVREPDILTDLIKSMPGDWREQVKFHVFGPIFHEFDHQLAGLPELELHDTVHREAVFPTMKAMDFLLNVGNTDNFQLPSKLADYLVSGLPVINLCQIADDSFAAAAMSHPMVLNLRRADDRLFSKKEIARLTEFLEKNRGARLSAGILESHENRFSARRVSGVYLRLIAENKKGETRRTG